MRLAVNSTDSTIWIVKYMAVNLIHAKGSVSILIIKFPDLVPDKRHQFLAFFMDANLVLKNTLMNRLLN